MAIFQVGLTPLFLDPKAPQYQDLKHIHHQLQLSFFTSSSFLNFYQKMAYHQDVMVLAIQDVSLRMVSFENH